MYKLAAVRLMLDIIRHSKPGKMRVHTRIRNMATESLRQRFMKFPVGGISRVQSPSYACETEVH